MLKEKKTYNSKRQFNVKIVNSRKIFYFYLFVATLSRCYHGLLSSLGKSEVVDWVRRPVAAQEMTHHVQVTTLSGVDQRGRFRFVDLVEKF
jgi:hypothetical protein